MYQKAKAPIREGEMDVFRAGNKRDWKKQSDEQRNEAKRRISWQSWWSSGINFVSRGCRQRMCLTFYPPQLEVYTREEEGEFGSRLSHLHLWLSQFRGGAVCSWIQRERRMIWTLGSCSLFVRW